MPGGRARTKAGRRAERRREGCMKEGRKEKVVTVGKRVRKEV